MDALFHMCFIYFRLGLHAPSFLDARSAKCFGVKLDLNRSIQHRSLSDSAWPASNSSLSLSL